HALRVALAAPLADAADLAALEARFVAQYLETYGTTLDGNPIEMVALSLICSGPAAQSTVVAEAATAHPAPVAARAAVFDPVSGARVDAAVLQRKAPQPGAFHEGPALVTEAQTTTWVPGGWHLNLHSLGHVILDRGV